MSERPAVTHRLWFLWPRPLSAPAPEESVHEQHEQAGPVALPRGFEPLIHTDRDLR